jgi:NADPH2:quinone reductase
MIKSLIAPRFPLAEARRAHELLGDGGVTGKIALCAANARQRMTIEHAGLARETNVVA